MPHNTTSAGTTHIRVLMEAALASSEGVRVPALTKGKAMNLRQQIHSYRNQERKKMAKAFPIDDPLHGISAYDCLVTDIISEAQDEGEPLFALRVMKAADMAKGFLILDEATGLAINNAEHL